MLFTIVQNLPCIVVIKSVYTDITINITISLDVVY